LRAVLRYLPTCVERDGLEDDEEFALGTDPLDPATDGAEAALGSNPLHPGSLPGLPQPLDLTGGGGKVQPCPRRWVTPIRSIFVGFDMARLRL